MKSITHQSKDSSKHLRFKFDGEFDSIDMEEVMKCQLNAIAILKEIAKVEAPGSRLSIKIKGTRKGSLGLESELQLIIPASLFIVKNRETITAILKILAELFQVKAKLKNLIPKFEPNKNGQMTLVNIVNSPGATVNFSNNTVSLYNNPTVAKSLNNIGEALENISSDVEAYQVTTKGARKKLINLPKSEFKNLSVPVISKSDAEHEKIIEKVRLHIVKPHLYPDTRGKYQWEFVYKGRPIKAAVRDESLKQAINGGIRLGQGDILVADLHVVMKFDKRLGTEVEGEMFVENVIDIIGRESDGVQLPIES